jgi:hypothetical protein
MNLNTILLSVVLALCASNMFGAAVAVADYQEAVAGIAALNQDAKNHLLLEMAKKNNENALTLAMDYGSVTDNTTLQSAVRPVKRAEKTN